MLRITAVQQAKGRTCLRLEGRIAGPWVGELARYCEATLRSDRPVTLDMAGVSFLDAEGLRLAGALRDRGFRLVGCSAFVTEQLQGGCHAPHTAC